MAGSRTEAGKLRCCTPLTSLSEEEGHERGRIPIAPPKNASPTPGLGEAGALAGLHAERYDSSRLWEPDDIESLVTVLMAMHAPYSKGTPCPGSLVRTMLWNRAQVRR